MSETQSGEKCNYENTSSEYLSRWSCKRPVWNNANQGTSSKCIWHAEIDQKPAKLLKKKWGNESEELRKQLDGAYLRGVDLKSKINFEECSLNQADFQHANLQNANLKAAELIQANFKNSDLKNANLMNAELTNANLQDSWLQDVKFQEAWLDEANLSEAKLENAQLQEANLAEANLQKSFLHNANLREAWLVRAKLQKAHLGKAGIQTIAIISWAENESSVLEEKVGGIPEKRTEKVRKLTDPANLEEAILEGVDLQNADLNQVDLQGSWLRNANLRGTNLQDADLSWTVLEDAILDETDLRNTDLTGSRWYHAFLRDTRINDETEFGKQFWYEITARRSNKGNKGDWEKTAWVYNRLESLFRENAMAEEARKWHFRKAEAERLHYWENELIVAWLAATAHRYLTGYGDLFRWIVAWIIITITVSTFMYLSFGFTDSEGTLRTFANPITSTSAQTFIEGLRYSIATFGFGKTNVNPHGWSTIVEILESLAGGFLVGLFGFVLGRRLP